MSFSFLLTLVGLSVKVGYVSHFFSNTPIATRKRTCNFEASTSWKACMACRVVFLAGTICKYISGKLVLSKQQRKRKPRTVRPQDKGAVCLTVQGGCFEA